ncbi:MAG: L-threonylcarbamoyladenylate synthase [bacterium]|nr:L-threonylcarbamoyladenylate synthase [bacterium]
MQEIKLSASNRIEALQKAVEVLKSGGSIIYPTETSYGLGCDFYNQEALALIYQIKHRDKNKPLPVIIPDITAASYLVDFKEEAKKLALKYWPGPLTLVLPFKYSKWHGHSDDYLALRVSSHPFASDLVCIFGHPIVSTSANISAKGDSYDPEKIKKQFVGEKFQPDLFINAGKLPVRAPSTIVKFDGEVKILRQGEINIKL